jgi:DNA polymerase-3 subunit epsilon
MGISLVNAHRATDDAKAAGHVMAAFLKDGRVPSPYGAFIKEQRRLGRLFEFERVRWR